MPSRPPVASVRARSQAPRAPVLAALLVGAAAVVPAVAPAQEGETPLPADTGDWDVTEPRGETREIDFTTSEGTAISVDVAPDGEWLVFDLVGHVYRMPITGGRARSLTQESGVAWNGQPRISPDGGHVAFVSDRAGQRDLWIMDADGSNPPRPVTSDRSVIPRTPAWTPDGRYLVVRRDRITDDGPDDEGLWMYHRDGGSGVQLVGEEEVDGAHWPSVSPDGRHLYFHRVAGGDPLNGDLQLRRYDFETGRIRDLTAGDNDGPAAGRVGSGGAYAPEVSPDGRRLAFARELIDGTISRRGEEYGPRNSLWIRDLETGAERKVMDPITLRGGELRIVPGYDWTPDGESVVIARGGKLHRLDVSSGEVEPIPFEARVHRIISEQAYHTLAIDDGPFRPRFLRWQTRSPDGGRLAFQAVGQVWTMELPDGEPRRITPGSFDRTEYAPAWSPDGEWLAFTGMDPDGRGHLYRIRPGEGDPERLTERKAFYTNPVWSPDGSEIVVTRGGGATARGRTVTHNAFFELVRVPGAGGAGTAVATVQPPSGTSPAAYARRAIARASYGPGGRIFFPEPMEADDGDDVVTGLVSVASDGSDRRVHMTFPFADEAVPSPGGDWVAFQEGDNAYVVPFPSRGTGGDPVHVERRDPVLPVTRVSREGGLHVRWPADSLLEYGSGDRHFTYRPATGAGDTTRIDFTVEQDRADGVIALVGARIVTPHDGRVIDEGTVVAEDGRLRCVAAAGECDTSDADRVVDASGKTIIPGLVDMHAHHYREHRGHRPRRDYEVAGYLAYGLTTTLDNSMWSENIFPTAERIRAGRMVGPRTYSTGDPLYQGDGPNQNEIDGYTAALENVRRLKSWGAVSIKQYSHPRRDQRQWIIDAARREGLAVTGHWNPGVVLDGHTGWEHSLDWPVIHRDLAELYGRAHVVYSPTLVVGGHPADNIEWFFQSDDVWRDDKQRDWMPWRMLTFLRERPKRPETDYSYPLTVQGVADVVAAGGHAAAGGHGEHHPLSPHWNIWMYAEVVGPMEALRFATSDGAWFLGASEDLGSLERGKLADLLVLDSNPLEEIRSTLDIRYVMKNARLYEADTLDEVWPRRRDFGERYWVDPAALVDDVRSLEPPR